MSDEQQALDERPAEDIDHDAVVDQSAVRSVVDVQGVLTIRTYTDGAVQRNVWPTPELAQEYADSVKAQEG